MEDAGAQTQDRAVPLADASVAAEIARAAARGKGSDRVPTLDQLLAAFGEREPTEAARRRVRAALEVAGVRVRPDVMDAPAGERVLLLPPGAGAPSRGRALAGLLALVAVLVAAVVAATVAGRDSGNRASNDLPPGTTTSPALTQTGTQPAAPAPAATTTTPAATDTTATATATTPATPATTTDQQAAADRRRLRQAAQRRDARLRSAAQARREVAVRVEATRPTFLCVEDGSGRQLFGGTLTGRRVFKGRHIKLNVGLASTRVLVNGRPVPLAGSPAGLDVTRKGGARPLPLGQRPCA